MASIQVQVLTQNEIKDIRDASTTILRDTGVMIHHKEMLRLLESAGADIDHSAQIARLPDTLVQDCVDRAAKQYVLHGRNRDRVARFGHGDMVLMSSPGQYTWIDSDTWERRAPTVEDLQDAIRLGDALPNVTIVGAMAVVPEIPAAYRDVYLTAELVKGTTKPTRCFVSNGRSAKYVLEIYRTAAGGDTALRKHPMIETFLEPISPLQLPEDGIDILMAFLEAGQPASFGPMAMTMGTAPATLAGTLAQENAEVLASLVVTQILAPGTPVTYGGIPHVMDPRTTICSFGSPEQALMAVALVQIARSYGFPVYVNVGITDAKILDAQAGIEKGETMVLGAMAGADTFGHAGICGTDHGASLPWLVVDDALMAYTKRIKRGFAVDADTLATDVVNAVGPGGNYLTQDHTMRHFRKEIWRPDALWTRQSWDEWADEGGGSMGDRARARVRNILATHEPEPIDETLAREIDRIVESARRELLSEL
ncbi:MAG: trimethylamine methyltransferase family protein [Anaerolineae bacterium]|nr:trimethylamine methyltransferase family protein [Anaerolineae bacterium]